MTNLATLEHNCIMNLNSIYIVKDYVREQKTMLMKCIGQGFVWTQQAQYPRFNQDRAYQINTLWTQQYTSSSRKHINKATEACADMHTQKEIKKVYHAYFV